MTGKPNKNEVLRYFSHDELLDLAKIKAKQEADDRITEAQRHLNSALNDLLSGAVPEPKRPGRPPKQETSDITDAPRRRGRPKGSTSKKKSGRKRAKNEKPLSELLLEVLNSTPKKVDEILNLLQEKGYKTTSKDPKSLMYLELNKLSKKGKVESQERGLYTKV